MARVLPQYVGIGSVAGTAVGNVLMAYAGYGESVVYACVIVGGVLCPLLLARMSRASQARRRSGWAQARVPVLGP